jgi:hypothetical protein
MNINDRIRYEEARQKVEKIKNFYTHLMVYVMVNILLVVINLSTLSSSGIWFIYPLLGWGIGIVSHAVSIFGFGGLFSKDWEERKIREIIEREEN